MKSLVEQPQLILRKIQRQIQGKNKQSSSILNEAINFDKQCIFIAIPKCGTNSVRSQLHQEDCQALIPNPHLSILQVRDILYTYLLMMSLEQNTSFPSQEVAADAEIRGTCQRIFATFFKFASVRNPWARAVSLYFRSEGVKMRKSISFEGFCEHHLYASDTCLHPTLHRNQLDWLVDEHGKVIMDYIFKVEEFRQAIKEIKERSQGRIKLQYRQFNTNNQSKSKTYRDLYTDHSRKLIAKRFEKDIDFFKYAF